MQSGFPDRSFSAPPLSPFSRIRECITLAHRTQMQTNIFNSLETADIKLNYCQVHTSKQEYCIRNMLSIVSEIAANKLSVSTRRPLSLVLNKKTPNY